MYVPGSPSSVTVSLASPFSSRLAPKVILVVSPNLLVKSIVYVTVPVVTASPVFASVTLIVTSTWEPCSPVTGSVRISTITSRLETVKLAVPLEGL